MCNDRYSQNEKLITSGDVTLAVDSNIGDDIKSLYDKDWVVYAKKPFGGPQQVVEYLGRYTHKVAITNHRIKEVNDQNKTVTFDYKDYSSSSEQKQMQLSSACKYLDMLQK